MRHAHGACVPPLGVSESVAGVGRLADNGGMSERRFFCEGLSAGVVALPADEAHHARNVVRVRVGQAVRLFDGRGNRADARVEHVGRDGVRLSVEHVEPADDVERPLPVTLAVAMPKAARQDVLIEKCTELGVRAVWPILAQRSVVRPRANRVEHWKRQAIAACKQSGRYHVPHILSPQPFAELLTVVGGFDHAVFGSTDPQADPLLDWLGSHPLTGNVLIVIGPEGGLTDDEQMTLRDAGASPVSLGSSILRTETAAIATLAVLAAWAQRSDRGAL